MWFVILLFAVVCVGQLVRAYVEYRRGTIAYSAKATRSEKNWRHLATLISAALGMLFVLGIHYAGIMSDRGLVLTVCCVGVVFLGRSIFIELGLRRVNSV